MIKARVAMSFEVTDAPNLDAQTDQVFEALLALEQSDGRLSDADMDAALAEGLVTVRIVADADTLDEALTIAGAAIRTAIHAAGGATPGWETPVIEPAPTTEFVFRESSLVAA